jgi:hypothetical protein
MAGFPFVVQPRRPPAESLSAGDAGSSRDVAVQLADSINRYWADLGYDAQARAVEMRVLDGRGSSDEFGVVSNLRNGVPARRLSDAAETGTHETSRDSA